MTELWSGALPTLDWWEVSLNLLKIILAVGAALILYRIGLRLIKKLMKIEESKFVTEDASKIIYLGLKTLLKYGLTFGVVLVILEIFDFEVIGADEIRALGTMILKTIGIIIIAKVVINVGRQVIDHYFTTKARNEEEQLLKERRQQTLNSLLQSILMYVVYFLAFIMILENFGIRTSSILAGVGVLGLAVSFGAQSLIKDVITGFFIMFEDQYSVEEYVTVNGVFGAVKELGLRTSKIQEWTGELHTIPNGEITHVVNYSRNHMLSLISVDIAYEEDIDQAIKVLEEEGKAAAAELETIVEDPTIQGVTDLGNSGVTIRAFCKTIPGEQWAVEREVRKRFKMALDRAGIEIPYPRRVVIHQEKDHNPA